jgi:hypothetical protein
MQHLLKGPRPGESREIARAGEGATVDEGSTSVADGTGLSASPLRVR